jgi:hypothetical protein
MSVHEDLGEESGASRPLRGHRTALRTGAGASRDDLGQVAALTAQRHATVFSDAAAG